MFVTFPACSLFGYFVSTETTSTTEEGFSSGLLSNCYVVKMLGQHSILCYFLFLRMPALNTMHRMSHRNSRLLTLSVTQSTIEYYILCYTYMAFGIQDML